MTGKSLLVLSTTAVNFEPISRLSDIFYDEVNKKICTVRGGGAMGVTARGPTSNDVISFHLPDKGTIYSIKLSPDLKVVAVQRSGTDVKFVNIVNGTADGAEYAQGCKGKNTRIIGIEWTAANEIVFITDHGLELYQVIADKKQVRSLKPHKATISWFVYSPETQILLTSSGPFGTLLLPFLITPGNIVRLGKFEAEIETGSKLALLDRDVCVAHVYGQVFVMILRHTVGNSSANASSTSIPNFAYGSQVLLYMLHKDMPGIVPRKVHILQLGSADKFAINVVDDLIVVHQQAAKNSLIFDIKSSGISDGSVSIHRPLAAPVSIVVPQGNISTDPESGYDPAVELYANTWRLFLPDVVVDAKAGCMWRLKLDLTAACGLIEDRCLLVEFLLRRSSPKGLLLNVLRENFSKQRVALTEAGAIWDVLSNVYKIHTEALAKVVESPAKVVIDQPDIHNHVFIPLIDDDKTDYDWLSKVMLEYLSSLQQRDIPVQPFMHELLVKSLVKCGEFQKLHQLVQYGVIVSSKPLAFLLLSLEAQYPDALQLAIDMLEQSETAEEEIVEILFAKENVVDALRYVQSCGVLDRVRPIKFLEAAWQTSNKHLQFTIFRYFEQRSLRTKGTAAFAKGEQFDQYAAEFQRLFLNNENESISTPVATLTHNGS